MTSLLGAPIKHVGQYFDYCIRCIQDSEKNALIEKSTALKVAAAFERIKQDVFTSSEYQVIAKQGPEAIMKALLSKNPMSQQELDEAVYCAAKGDYYLILTTLLHHGSLSEKRKGEALVVAVMQEHLTSVEALLQDQSRISLEDKESAVIHAATCNHLKILKALLAERSTISDFATGFLIRASVWHGNLDIIKDLLKEGVNIPEEIKIQAAKIASQRHHVDIVDFFSSMHLTSAI